MKKYIRLFIGTVFVVPLVAMATTALVSAESTSTSTNSTTTSTTPASTTETEKANDPGLLSRLADSKASLKTKLTTTEQTHLKDKCKVAQTGGVSSLSTRVAAIETSRNETYTNLVAQLNALEAKVKTKNLDTTKLDAEIVALNTKIATFQADLAKYKQALIDLKSMDCVSDPTAFKAALQSARTLHDQVGADATAIKSYVTDTIKPTLQDLKTQLAALEKTSSTTGGTQ